MTHCADTQHWIIPWQATTDWDWLILDWDWLILDWLIRSTMTILPGALRTTMTILCTGVQHI